jgi:hypothetical protein
MNVLDHVHDQGRCRYLKSRKSLGRAEQVVVLKGPVWY